MRAPRFSLWLVALVLGALLLVVAACGSDGEQTRTGGSRLPYSEDANQDDGSNRLLEALVGGLEQEQQALDEIVATSDLSFASVLIELLRAHELGIVAGRRSAVVDALERLTGEPFDDDWPAWVEWYGGTSLEPPPGFVGWKGALLARIDERFGEFLNEGTPSTIRVEEVMWGGVAVDGIPALDRPQMIAPAQADYLVPDEPVFGIELNGDARAYPLRIMDWHEMANDVVGGIPISLAYCTLCGAGIAYDGRASDGRTYDFGSSGLLFRSNKLMYDRQTRTLWNQFTGEPVIGSLVGSDVRLERAPVVLTTWESWRAQHPDSLVLSLDTGYRRLYQLGAAYGSYFRSPETMFPGWRRRDDLEAKARVYGMHVDGLPKAYPTAALAAEKVVNDVVGETRLVLVSTRGIVSVFPEPVDYEAGSEVRAYERGAETFAPGPDPDTLVDDAGRAWRITEEALIGPDGERAPRVAGHLAYWFGWYAFFPRTLLYGQPDLG